MVSNDSNHSDPHLLLHVERVRERVGLLHWTAPQKGAQVCLQSQVRVGCHRQMKTAAGCILESALERSALRGIARQPGAVPAEKFAHVGFCRAGTMNRPFPGSNKNATRTVSRPSVAPWTDLRSLARIPAAPALARGAHAPSVSRLRHPHDAHVAEVPGRWSRPYRPS